MPGSFSIAQIFEQAFGLGRGRPYNPPIEQGPAAISGEPLPEITDNSEEGATFLEMRQVIAASSPLGRPLFMPVQIGDLVLPNEPTIYIVGSKNIIETPLAGNIRRGAVKELINTNDYSVTIRGIAINYNSTLVYPEDQVRDINELFLEDQSLEIKCALTAILGIYRVVIRQVVFPEMRGIQHAQAYELQCVSDEDFILELE